MNNTASVTNQVVSEDGKGNGWFERLCGCFVMTGFSAMFTYLLLLILYMPTDFFIILGTAAATAAVMTIASVNRVVAKVAYIAMGVGVVGFLFYMFTAQSVLVKWFIDYFNGYVIYDAGKAVTVVPVLAVLITAAAYTVACELKMYRISSIAGLVVLIFGTMYGANVELFFILPFVALIITLYISGVLNSQNRIRSSVGISRNTEFKKKPGNRVFVWALPFLIVVIALGAVLPKSNKPVTWKWLDDMYFEMYNTLSVIQTPKNNVFNRSYQVDGGALDGRAYISNIHVMDVLSERSLYLKSTTKDTYTGNSWVSNVEEGALFTDNAEDVNEPRMVDYELTYGPNFLERRGSTIIRRSYMPTTMIVSFRRMRADYLFAPLYFDTLNISSEDNVSVGDNNILALSNGSLLMEQRRGGGFNYNLTSRGFNFNDEDIQNLLRHSYVGLYENAEGGFGDFRNFNSEEEYEEAREFLAERSNDIWAKYTDVPQRSQERILDLALEISEAAGAENNYDRVKAIEMWLSNQMRYTLTPRKRPAGRDFVEHFLFDGREGYCTAYASAMVMLVRSMGIPARYSEGYAMPSRPNDDNVFQVKSNNAHAWPEVYFEGFGWIPFEPTSEFTEKYYSAMKFIYQLPEKEEEDPVSETSTSQSWDEDEYGYIDEEEDPTVWDPEDGDPPPYAMESKGADDALIYTSSSTWSRIDSRSEASGPGQGRYTGRISEHSNLITDDDYVIQKSSRTRPPRPGETTEVEEEWIDEEWCYICEDFIDECFHNNWCDICDDFADFCECNEWCDICDDYAKWCECDNWCSICDDWADNCDCDPDDREAIAPGAITRPSASGGSGGGLTMLATWPAVLLSIIMLLIILLVSKIIYNLRAANGIGERARNMPIREGVLLIYLHMLKMLNHCKMGIRLGETTEEYAKALADGNEFFERSKFAEVSRIFENARYGEKELNALEIEKLIASQDELDSYLRGKMGAIKYFMKRVVFN
ncbi:MAG: transglutaminase domain-containing protein [Oscillospiraceae bacterium]|nr:transglutaminase domain-containing protein [Oscillospiraceae bacterium]